MDIEKILIFNIKLSPSHRQIQMQESYVGNRTHSKDQHQSLAIDNYKVKYVGGEEILQFSLKPRQVSVFAWDDLDTLLTDEQEWVSRFL